MQIMERLYCRNLEIFVIPQPDGTRARLPAWMFDEAAQRFVIAEQATFPIVAMRGLRAEIDLLLGTSLGVLGGLIVVRTFLGWTLILEIEGRWPWQREHRPTPPSDGQAAGPNLTFESGSPR